MPGFLTKMQEIFLKINNIKCVCVCVCACMYAPVDVLDLTTSSFEIKKKIIRSVKYLVI